MVRVRRSLVLILKPRVTDANEMKINLKIISLLLKQKTPFDIWFSLFNECNMLMHTVEYYAENLEGLMLVLEPY